MISQVNKKRVGCCFLSLFLGLTWTLKKLLCFNQDNQGKRSSRSFQQIHFPSFLWMPWSLTSFCSLLENCEGQLLTLWKMRKGSIPFVLVKTLKRWVHSSGICGYCRLEIPRETYQEDKGSKSAISSRSKKQQEVSYAPELTLITSYLMKQLSYFLSSQEFSTF